MDQGGYLRNDWFFRDIAFGGSQFIVVRQQNHPIKSRDGQQGTVIEEVTAGESIA